jgi:hypothetical protein
MSDPRLDSPLSPDEVRQLEHTCDRFEAAWKAGQRPHPEEYLGAASEPARSALLRQLLLLDWDYRRRAGDDPRPGDYLHGRACRISGSAWPVPTTTSGYCCR